MRALAGSLTTVLLLLAFGSAALAAHPDDVADAKAQAFLAAHKVAAERLKLAMDPAVLAAAGAAGFSGYRTRDKAFLLYFFSFNEDKGAAAGRDGLKQAMETRKSMVSAAAAASGRVVLVVGLPEGTALSSDLKRRRDRLAQRFSHSR